MLFKDNRLLFFDYHHIASLDNVSLTLNPPEKRGACLCIERPWELGHCRASNVVFHEGEYRLYYTISPNRERAAADRIPRMLAFAVSKDGIKWERPNLGAVDFDGSRKNNITVTDSPQYGEVCVFVDPDCPPEHRFKCICHHPWQGLWLLTSPDGIHFSKAHEDYILKYGTDNNMTVFWDPTIAKYRVYLRGGDKSREVMGWKGSRCVVYCETRDLTKPLPVDRNAPDPHDFGIERPGLDGKPVRPLPGVNKEMPKVIGMDDMDPPEADLYQLAGVHYAPNSYLGFPTLYWHYPGPPDGFINDGWLDLQFASSRDGRLWSRSPRASYVRLDQTGGPTWKQMHMVIGMAAGERSIYQYYCGSRLSHGEGRTPEDRYASKVRQYAEGDPIALRLEQRTDGFVSADSAYTGGILVTRPFVLRSDTLAVNIDTSASGAARAAILDRNGLPIKGFTLEDSDFLQANDTHINLKWKGSPDLGRLKGKTISLLVKSRSAKVFAVYPEPAEAGDVA